MGEGGCMGMCECAFVDVGLCVTKGNYGKQWLESGYWRRQTICPVSFGVDGVGVYELSLAEVWNVGHPSVDT